MVGDSLRQYRILEQIGAGGMGVVFRAHDDHLERDVAIKVLPPGTLSDESARRRFKKEAVSLAQLNHPHIATIHEFGSQDKTDFLVTEYVAGESLDAKVARGPSPSDEVVRLGLQLAQGLAAAHAQGIVHRDLKPANLRLTSDGRLKILDFGLAQFVHPEGELAQTMSLTNSEQITGTLPYMAPEQLRGQPADRRTDIWAAGAVLYELATGERPFRQKLGPLLIDAILNYDVEPASARNPQVSPALNSVISKALQKNPEHRYQTVQELQADLERITAGIRPQAASTAQPFWRSAALGSAIIGLLLSLAFWVGRKHNTQSTSQINATRSSVAVLGFKNLSGRPDTAWLSTALSEMLTTELAAGEKLLTISGENVARAKSDLSIPETDSLAVDTLARIRKNLGSDFVILGSYFDLGDGSEIRLDLRVQNASTGEMVSSFTKRGTEARLDDLITQAGSELRRRIGVGDVGATEEVAVKAELPSNVEASRLYAEGLEKLRNFDPQSARDLLQKAVAADPRHALSYASLAAAWSSLGYELKAAEAARRAFDLSAGLPHQERTRVEAEYYATAHQWDKAIEVFRGLYQGAPDNLEYGLRLANTQILAGKANDAVTTLSLLRKLPSPKGNDLRIDLAEVAALRPLSDFKRQEQLAAKLAERAHEQGARWLVSKARQFQCSALRNLGDPKRSVPICEEAQQIARASGDHGGEAAAMNSVANALYDLGDLAGARSKYEQVARLYRSMGSVGGLAGAMDNTANVISDQGDFAKARKLSQEALTLYRETGDQTGIGETLNNLATEMMQQGELAQAEKTFEESLDLWRKMGSPSGVATSLTNLGGLRISLGDIPGAKTAYAEAWETFKTNQERSKSAYALIGLGDVAAAAGDLVTAKKNYQEALAITREAGEKHESAVALSSLGAVVLQMGDLADARQCLKEASTIRAELGEKSGSAETGVVTASLQIEEGQARDAEATARQAVNLATSARNPSAQLSAHTALAKAQLATGRVAEAAKQIYMAKELADRTQYRVVRLEFQIVAAQAQAASGKSSDVKAAIALLEQTLNETEKSGLVNLLYQSKLALGQIEMRTGKSDQGRVRLVALEKDAKQAGFGLIARKAAKLSA